MSKRRLTPRKPSGKIRRGSRAWSELIAYLEHEQGGAWNLTCAICRRGAHQIGVHPRTGRPLWHLDHTTPLRQVDPLNEGIDADVLLDDVRWLCRDCNLRRGGGRTDQRVMQLNARAQRKPTTTNAALTLAPNTWQLTPKPKTETESEEAILMREMDPPGTVFEKPLPSEKSGTPSPNNPSEPDMAAESTNTSNYPERVSGGDVR